MAVRIGLLTYSANDRARIATDDGLKRKTETHA
jgi:hypothetical protein